MTRVALVALALAPMAWAGSAVAQIAAPREGISRELARARAATLADVAYHATLRIPEARDSAVTGEIRIDVRTLRPGPLVLDFADPAAVHHLALDGAPAPYRASANHVVVPDVSAGSHTVRLAFTAGDAPFNRRGEFLYTLFVPDRAHEVLPVFDQPDLKARFHLTLSVPEGWRAVANGAEVSREAGAGRVVYRFAETEPIPTYLFAFVAGRFDVEEAERAGRRMRLFHRETDSTKVARSLDALFDLHATALSWLEGYTGIPYPFGKFDFVAVPSFQYNGMEHPGAILYRASSLFLDASATRNQELGRASVIAHETAHMWFGDLVTMPWFDDVWMKEVFANFMAARIVNPSFPDLDHELRFLLAHYPAAYSVDRTAGANPVRQPLENLDEAGSLYGAIIYQKAPIVMRQLERLVGEEPFRQAVRRYLDAHRFGNAGWPALVAELDRAAGLDVPAWSRAWIDEPGRPRIRVEIETGQRDSVRIHVRQEDPRSGGTTWDQRLDLALVHDDSAGAVRPVRLDPGPRTLTIPAPRAVLPNATGLAYGLFVLDPGTINAFLAGLPDLEPPVARAAAWIDLWELMLEGGVAPADMLDLAGRVLAAETDELIVQEVLGDLSDLFWRYLNPERRGREGPRLETLLWDGLERASSPSRKAAWLNAWRAMATTDSALARMEALWGGELEIQGLTLSERDRTTLALNLAVREVPGWERILDAQAGAIENPDRRERFAFIRPAVSGPAVRDSFFASLTEVEHRAREEWVVAALEYLHHPLRAETSLGYVGPALELLEEIRATGDIFFPTRWLAATLSGHASPEAAAVVSRFLEAHPELPPRLREKVLQEADPLFRAVALRDLQD